jgi:shikimate dehydrogenase
MHNAAFAALGLDFAYLPFDVRPEELKNAVAGIRALSIVGVNVTVPHKETVLDSLDVVTEAAGLIGAVNTIVNHDGRLTGYNTDAIGFLKALEDTGFDPQGKEAAVLGAGGAARAVGAALGMSRIRRITFFNRTLERAKELAQMVAGATGVQSTAVPWEEMGKSGMSIIRSADIVVQTTSIGMHPREAECPPVPADAFRKDQVVVDLVYNPAPTRFLKRAAAAGARTQDGVRMLLHQGAAAFELWTGRPAPITVMENALKTAQAASQVAEHP